MKRYSSKPFPTYQYIPKQHPHPREHPQGHSYLKVDTKLEFNQEHDLANSEIYLYGVDLFNFGYFWECHEAWEQIWLKLKSESKYHLFFQGLILAAAGFLKIKMHEMHTSKKLFQSCITKHTQLITLLQNQNIIFRLDVLSWIHKLESHLLKQDAFPYIILVEAGSKPASKLLEE